MLDIDGITADAAALGFEYEGDGRTPRWRLPDGAGVEAFEDDGVWLFAVVDREGGRRGTYGDVEDALREARQFAG